MTPRSTLENNPLLTLSSHREHFRTLQTYHSRNRRTPLLFRLGGVLMRTSCRAQPLRREWCQRGYMGEIFQK
jgi:hypothetical protein